MPNKNYTSKDIKTLEGIEAVRMRPAMYIGGVDSEGLHHILLEAISNSIDEALNGYGEEIFIVIDSKANRATVTDFGRGIPFGKTNKGTEAMKDIATSLHSGGKFGQEDTQFQVDYTELGLQQLTLYHLIFLLPQQETENKRY